MEFDKFRKAYRDFRANCVLDNINREFFADMPVMLNIKDKELSDSELYAVWYMIENGFTVLYKTCNSSRTELVATKGEVSDLFTLTAATQNPRRCDIKQYMELFSKSFAMKEELVKLRALKEPEVQ